MSPKAIGFVQHCAGVKLRVDGSGDLQMKMIAQGGVKEAVMVPLIMISPDDQSRTKLVNFKNERMQLEFKTTEIDEWFEITLIQIFLKPVASGYPG